VAIGIEAVGFVALPVVVWLLPFRLDAFDAALAFAGGALGGLGLIAFYRAMAMNLIGVVAPVTAVVAAALPVGVGLLFAGDRLHAGQIAGIAVGLVAIGLINGGGDVTHAARAAIGLAVLAGLGFGMFFVLYHRASAAGATAFVCGRVASALAAVGLALVTRVPLLPRREVWPLLGVGGSLDGLGVVLFLVATFNGLLSLSALLTSFYPAFTVLCARVFLHERMAVVQAGGAVLALVAVVLIAAT
jgi:drug/metabolite transporter (DMT)-like permease